jgi:hypothetical protein
LKLPAIHNAGLPDRLCLFPGGEVVFVELKAPERTWTGIRLEKSMTC